MIELRDYQRHAIQTLRERIREGIKSIVLVMMTGAGKTVVAASVMHGALKNGSRLVFVAHRRELLVQCYQKMLDMGVPETELGIVMADGKIRLRDGRLIKAVRPSAPIQIASIDTLRHRTKPEADIIFIDECHRALSKSYMDLKVEYPDAIHIGLTATPFRFGGVGLHSYYQDMVIGALPSFLVQEGFIVKPRVWTVPADELPDLSKLKTLGGDYREDELAEVCNTRKLVGSIVTHWQHHAEGRRTICFPVNIEHSHNIVRDFVEAGIRAEHLDGKTPSDVRDAMIARLASGETQVLSSVGVLCEGFDLPAAKCCILARPTRSEGLYLQMAGRILRPWNGVGAMILDHAGCVLEFGSPADDREFSLQDKKLRRKEGPASKTCLGCYAVVETFHKECPACGKEFPTKAPSASGKGIEHVEGTLIEYSDEEQERQRRAYWNDLCRMANENNYKVSWAKNCFKERYGFAPPKSYPIPLGRPLTKGETDVLRERLKHIAAQRNLPPSWIEREIDKQSRTSRAPEVPDGLVETFVSRGVKRAPAAAATPQAAAPSPPRQLALVPPVAAPPAAVTKPAETASHDTSTPNVPAAGEVGRWDV